jgi:hypothetical protein
MAWRGKIDYPHPHQRHLFDLDTLNTLNGRNVAVERLYRWATGGDKALADKNPLDYSVFLDKCVEYLARFTPTSNEDVNTLSIDDQVAGRLADHVVEFFKNYYRHQFEDVNLFELLNKAAPPPHRDQTRAEQIRGYILDHLLHIRGLMRSLIAFEAQLAIDGLANLDVSLYLGMYWRDGNQEELLNQVLSQMPSLTHQGHIPIKQLSYDPHRLDVSYGQHAISLNTTRDFYREENSAMQFYLSNQAAWSKTEGKGLMPVHSSCEAQRLVHNKNALGYTTALTELVIRRTHESIGDHDSYDTTPGQMGDAQEMADMAGALRAVTGGAPVPDEEDRPVRNPNAGNFENM